MESVKKIKRLTIEVDQDFHVDIKSRSTVRNMTIKEWILQAISEKICKEKQAK